MDEKEEILTKETKAVGAIADRIKLCQECPNLNKLKLCKLCGCFMPAKVRLKSASCPDGKWGPLNPPAEPYTGLLPHEEHQLKIRNQEPSSDE